MQVRKLLKDDSAVSPVIGVILMVAITVILAAVIATFVLGLGDSISETAPQASFSVNYEGGENTGDSDDGYDGMLTVAHDGGESIRANELHIRGTPGGNDDGAWSNTDTGTASYTKTEMISAGASIDIDVDSGSTVRVVYESEEGSSSATLGKWSGPDA